MSPGLPRSQAASAAQRTFLQLFGGNVLPLVTVFAAINRVAGPAPLHIKQILRIH